MKFLRGEAIQNVVVLSGDVHAAFAGVIMDDFDAALPQPAAYELVGPGVSSNSLFSFFEAATRTVPAGLRGLITVDASARGGSKFTENLNLLLLHGTRAAGAFAATKDLATALSVADPNTNSHLKYIDSNAQGYGYLKISADSIDAKLITINRPTAAPSDAGPGIRRTASFTIAKNNPGALIGPVITGSKPFPLT